MKIDGTLHFENKARGLKTKEVVVIPFGKGRTKKFERKGKDGGI